MQLFGMCSGKITWNLMGYLKLWCNFYEYFHIFHDKKAYREKTVNCSKKWHKIIFVRNFPTINNLPWFFTYYDFWPSYEPKTTNFSVFSQKCRANPEFSANRKKNCELYSEMPFGTYQAWPQHNSNKKVKIKVV